MRDYYFTMISELVEEHDFEGLELDWLRCPFCCEVPASQKTIDLMTTWVADIRAPRLKSNNNTLSGSSASSWR